MNLRRILALFIFAFALPAIAQQYPTKPVRVLVGYAAGSSTDIVGRVMADRLGAYWKQTVIVENRGGAAGNLAADAVAKAHGDGYTLLFAQNASRSARPRCRICRSKLRGISFRSRRSRRLRTSLSSLRNFPRRA